MYFEIDRKYPHSCINFVQIWLTALHQPWDTNFSIVSFRLFSKKIDRIVFLYHSFHFSTWLFGGIMIYAKWQRCFISAMFRQIQHPSRISGSRYDYQPSSEKCNVCALLLHSVTCKNYSSSIWRLYDYVMWTFAFLSVMTFDKPTIFKSQWPPKSSFRLKLGIYDNSCFVQNLVILECPETTIVKSRHGTHPGSIICMKAYEPYDNRCNSDNLAVVSQMISYANCFPESERYIMRMICFVKSSSLSYSTFIAVPKWMIMRWPHVNMDVTLLVWLLL